MPNPTPDWNLSFDLQRQNQVKVHDEMRGRCPNAYSETLGWPIFRHEDVLRILNDHDSFSGAVSQHLSVPNGLDPPEHAAYRNMIERYFAVERIHAFEPSCRKIADELIVTAMNGRDDADWWRNFVLIDAPLPVQRFF